MIKGHNRSSLSSANAGRHPKASTSRPSNKTNDKSADVAKLPHPKSRHRASVACASCRDRRIRCVVPSGETRCIQCGRAGVDCVIKNDDERRKPISRAYMSSLVERISLLESMLAAQGTTPPPANHPPPMRHAGSDDVDPIELSPNISHPVSEHNGNTNARPEAPMRSESSTSSTIHFMDSDSGLKMMSSNVPDNRSWGPGPAQAPMIHQRNGMIRKLLSTQGHLSFDQLNGRLRYFGPTTNCHVHSDSGSMSTETKESHEHKSRAAHIIRSLPAETYEYLMELFWQHYNSVMHVIHREAFTNDYKHGRSTFYSTYLHVCVLAMGYRFADKSRPDMQRLLFASRQSTLHKQVKDMLDNELEQPGGVTSVVALLLLGDLECGIGRDNLGWMYSGMAIRLAFDIGLHLDSRASGFVEREVEIRQMTLWACVIYDKYWAMFLGRPTSMKSSDLEIYHLAKQFERLGTCKPAGPDQSLETLIYEALLDLMELTGRIFERSSLHKEPEACFSWEAYSKVVSLDRELNRWYLRLPEPLKWGPENVRNAPFSFFLLHQQYHSSLILLHRPFSQYEDDTRSEEGSQKRVATLSRSVCTKHAVCISKIIWQYRPRGFDTRQMCISGLQHVGTAATALITALAFMKDSNDRNNNMQYLECVAAALKDMSETYQPAERMSTVLQAVVAELRGPSSETTEHGYRTGGHFTSARRSTTAPEHTPPLSRRETFSQNHALGMDSKPSGVDATAVHTPPMTATPPEERDMHHDLHVPAQQIESSVWNPPPPMANAHPMNTSFTSMNQVPFPLSMDLSMHAWMGAPSLDIDPNELANLASVHLPEINPNKGGGNSHLDFMHVDTNDWRQWQGGEFQPGMGDLGR